jgi:hypothetical protein
MHRKKQGTLTDSVRSRWTKTTGVVAIIGWQVSPASTQKITMFFHFLYSLFQRKNDLLVGVMVRE